MNYIKSPINYIGNKYKLISQIEPLFPREINTFYDLFGGSGTVLINTIAKKYVYNDINPYVANIFQGLVTQSPDDTIKQIENIIAEYKLSITNQQGFEKLRDDYNNGRNDWLTLYALMCYSFNHQFRFNSKHQYNSSFGRNRSYFSERQKNDLINLMTNIKSPNNISFCTDSFDKVIPIILSRCTSDDLVYLDPPYFNSTGNYNDGKRGFEGWTKEHETKLIDCLTKLHNNHVRFAISNNLKYENLYLIGYLEKSDYIKVHYLKGDYVNCNYHKIDRSKDIEVLITNY